jgi:20S proteasome alpha/beta subunit
LTLTSIVGILCKDGVVIGTDSAATFGCGTVRTIEQPVKKISVLEKKCIVAGTGRVGLGQRFCSIVEDYATKNQNAFRSSPHVVANALTKKTLDDFRGTLTPPGQYGALVAFTDGKSFHLCEFDTNDFQPEFKEPGSDIWFVSMGSGQTITDPFLGFMRKVFFHDSPPSVVDAILITTWTLQHAIELNAGGVNGPSQIAIIRKEDEDSKYSATMLSQNELQEHLSNVTEAEEYLSKYREILQGRSGTHDIPEINE